MFTAAYLANRAPYSVLCMQSPRKMLNRTEPDLRHLRPIEATAIVNIERRIQKLTRQLEDDQLVRCKNDSNPATRRIIVSRSVVFVEESSRAV
ncbi:unnamed protein product, partial [Sphacelaria rigidula]